MAHANEDEEESLHKERDVERQNNTEEGASVGEEDIPHHTCQKCNEHITDIGENRIRVVSRDIHAWLMSWGVSSKAIGAYYQICHYILIVCGTFVVVFNNHPWQLLVLLIIISLDGFANVVVHDCPLTSLEERYLQNSLSHERRESLRNAQICYGCKHVYESQVDLIINMWTMVACKIVIILAMRTITPAFLAM